MIEFDFWACGFPAHVPSSAALHVPCSRRARTVQRGQKNLKPPVLASHPRCGLSILCGERKEEDDEAVTGETPNAIFVAFRKFQDPSWNFRAVIASAPRQAFASRGSEPGAGTCMHTHLATDP